MVNSQITCVTCTSQLDRVKYKMKYLAIRNAGIIWTDEIGGFVLAVACRHLDVVNSNVTGGNVSNLSLQHQQISLGRTDIHLER